MNRIGYVVATIALVAGAISLWSSHRSQSELQRTRAEFAALHARMTGEIRSLHEALARHEASRPVAVAVAPARQEQERLREVEGRRERVENDSATEPTKPSTEQNLTAESFAALDPRSKMRALRGLEDQARQGDATALQLILAGLDDTSENVREEAVESLGEIGDPATFDAVVALQADPVNDVREEVAEAMGAMPATRAGPVLAQMLSDRSNDVVEQALESLGRIEYRNALPEILQVVRGDNLELVARSVRVLRSFGEEGAATEALQRVVGGLDSREALDRMHTVRYLRRAGGEQAIEYLQLIAQNDASFSVREEAREALDRLRN
jgi:hypothetical protein